jgi:hypothetical protein
VSTLQVATPDQLVRCVEDTKIRVCYSSHCSYNELADFLVSLNPDAIFANVKPSGISTLGEVNKTLSAFTRQKRAASPPPPIPFFPGWIDVRKRFRKNVIS